MVPITFWPCNPPASLSPALVRIWYHNEPPLGANHQKSTRKSDILFSSSRMPDDIEPRASLPEDQDGASSSTWAGMGWGSGSWRQQTTRSTTETPSASLLAIRAEKKSWEAISRCFLFWNQLLHYSEVAAVYAGSRWEAWEGNVAKKAMQFCYFFLFIFKIPPISAPASPRAEDNNAVGTFTY